MTVVGSFSDAPPETIQQASYRIKQASVVCQDSKWHPLWGVWHLGMSRGTSQAGDRFNRDRPWCSACLQISTLTAFTFLQTQAILVFV